MPMPLFKLSSTFSLDSTKGQFSHKRNTYNAYLADAEVDFPPAEDFEPNYMSTSAREKFLEWHARQVGKKFRLREELLYYCRQDVSVLR